MLAGKRAFCLSLKVIFDDRTVETRLLAFFFSAVVGIVYGFGSQAHKQQPLCRYIQATLSATSSAVKIEQTNGLLTSWASIDAPCNASTISRPSTRNNYYASAKSQPKTFLPYIPHHSEIWRMLSYGNIRHTLNEIMVVPLQSVTIKTKSLMSYNVAHKI